MARKDEGPAEEKNKQELEEMKKVAEQSREEYIRAMQDHDRIVQLSLKALRKRCLELEEKQQHMENDADKIRLGKQRVENKRQLAMVRQQTKMQKKHKVDEVKLIKKHKKESMTLEKWIQQKKLQLANHQQKELDCERLERMMDAEKFKEIAGSFLVDELIRNTEELEEKLKGLEKQKLEFEEQLQNLKDENDHYSTSVNVLNQKQRVASDELEEARKLSVKAIKHYGVKGVLERKSMGEIREGPWLEACRKRFTNHPDGWEVVQKTMYSEWEELVKNPKFNPFIVVQTGETGTWEKIVDDKNEQLQKLRKELGEEVYETVITALTEIEDYNPSGRYPTSVVWSCVVDKRATVGEVLTALVAKVPKKKGISRTEAHLKSSSDP